jgi:hypothetical protein
VCKAAQPLPHSRRIPAAVLTRFFLVRWRGAFEDKAKKRGCVAADCAMHTN